MDSIDSFDKLSRAKGFKMAHLNVRSIVKKIDQLRILLQDSNIDVLTISETWMRSYMETQLVELQGFKSYRLDRGHGNRRKRGGGLITYVNEKHAVHCEALEELDRTKSDIEAQWVLICRPECRNVVVCNLYRPPTGNLFKALQYLEECIKSVNLSKTNVFLLGDMNVNYRNKSSPDYKKVHFFNQTNGFTQYINTTTRNTDKSKSLIDLAITNSKFVSDSGTLEHFISDHQPIFVVHKKGRDKRETVQFEGRSYRTFDKDSFAKQLRESNWDELYNSNTPDQAWSCILGKITMILDTMCPKRNFRIKNYRPDWMTNELIEQIKDRDYFYFKAKKTGDSDYWNIAKYMRNMTNSNIRQAKKEFILDELRAHQDDAKKFWKVIQKVVPSGKKAGKGDILLKKEGIYLEKGEVAHYINDYFINVGNVPMQEETIEGNLNQTGGQDNNNNNNNPSGSSECGENEKFGLGYVRESEVFRIIKEINTSKSSGLNGVNSTVVKEAFKSLTPEITFMMNLSIRTAVYPNAWKEALVIPIPKSGNLTQVQNYRPISLLPLPGKIMEKLVHGQLSSHLEQQHLLSDSQHGFRKQHSTVHSIAQFTNFVNCKIDRNPHVSYFYRFPKGI